jgi:hypothetical protein
MNRTAHKILSQVKSAIRSPFAWPGGYPISIICTDSGALCPDCAKKHFRLICADTIGRYNTGWRAAGAEILWEGGNYCDQCNANLDAYPADETADASNV